MHSTNIFSITYHTAQGEENDNSRNIIYSLLFLFLLNEFCYSWIYQHKYYQNRKITRLDIQVYCWQYDDSNGLLGWKLIHRESTHWAVGDLDMISYVILKHVLKGDIAYIQFRNCCQMKPREIIDEKSIWNHRTAWGDKQKPIPEQALIKFYEAIHRHQRPMS